MPLLVLSEVSKELPPAPLIVRVFLFNGHLSVRRRLSSCSMLFAESVICHPDFTPQFTLYTEVSQTAMDAVLAQDIDSIKKVVAYTSQYLSSMKKTRWSTYDREFWAIAWVVQHLRHYLGLGISHYTY